MEISGIQPNCSELVIRLGTTSRKVALNQLRQIGVKEYLVKNMYGSQEDNDWDDEVNLPEMIETCNLVKEIEEAWVEMNGDEYEKARKTLIKNGIDPDTASNCLLEDGKGLDKEHHSHMWLSRYPFGDGEELAVWYSQHCQRQGFKLLEKIAMDFGQQVEAHDGGSIDNYNEWVGEETDD